MTRLASLRLLVGLAGLALVAGCTHWEELPEGATGFLSIEDARLTGEMNGVAVDGRPARVTGYCTASGWMVELAGRGDGGVVMSGLDIQNLFWGDSATAVFRAQEGRRTMSLESSTGDEGWGGGEATAVVEGCAGPSDGSWEVEERAELAIVEVESLGWSRMRVHFTAEFPSGDVVEGQFDATMPARD